MDGTGTIAGKKKDDNAIWYKIQASPHIMRYVVEKGSITVDGISLTVAKVEDNNFSISAIPHTVSQTVLKDRKEGDIVNLENDIIGKYVEKLLYVQDEETIGARQKQNTKNSTITKDFLAKYGY